MGYEHGTLSCYTHRGCRCEPCVQAKAEYRRDWLDGPPRMVDVRPLAPGLRELYHQGLTIGQIARRAGTQHQTMSKIMVGRKLTARRVLAENLAGMLAGQREAGKLGA